MGHTHKNGFAMSGEEGCTERADRTPDDNARFIAIRSGAEDWLPSAFHADPACVIHPIQKHFRPITREIFVYSAA